jgi:hypothetical protein
MQFCKDCGTALNLFGHDDRELCSSCVQQKKRHAPPPLKQKGPATAAKETNASLLADAVLSVENNKIVVRAKEGWELWSGPADKQTDLKTILAAAGRIYEIRLRRQKN